MKGTCTKCKEEKALSEFYKSKDSRGYSYHCRKCTSERSKRRAKEIRAEVIDWTNQLYSGEELRIQLEAISKLNSKKLWSLRSKLNKLLGEKFDSKAYKQDYYQKNKEVIDKKNREYAAKNKDKVNAYRKKWISENKERNAEHKRLWHESNYLQTKLSSCKHRALKNNIPFDIELSDLEVPEICPVLHIPIRLSKTGKQTANSPSIDKIIPEMGYTKGNIQIISNKANKMKSDATPLDLILFAAWVLNNFDIDLYTTELEGDVEETLF